MFNIHLSGREVAIFVGGAALSMGAYFARRWIQGDYAKEALERYSKTLDLHQALKASGLSVSDLDGMQGRLTDRRRRTRQIEDAVAHEVVADQSDDPSPGKSQDAMSALATADVQISRAKMKRALSELSFIIDAADVGELEASQKAWATYSEAQARLMASPHAGGSIYATIYASELEAPIVARIADLRAHLERLKSM